MTATIHQFPDRRTGRVSDSPPSGDPAPGPATPVASVANLRAERARRDLVTRGIRPSVARALVDAIARSESCFSQWSMLVRRIGAEGATDFLEEHRLLVRRTR